MIDWFRRAPTELFIDALSDTHAAGWAWCPSRPEERLTLEIVDGQEIVGEVIADRYREDLETAGKGDGRYAFEFRFPKTIPASRLHRVTFRRKGQKSPERIRKFKQLSIQHFVDVFDGTHVAGWAWLPSKPNERLTLEFLDGSQVIGKAIADGYRADLERAGKGDGCHAFDFRLPASVFDGRSHQIHIRNQGGNRNIYSSPEIVLGKLNVDVDSFFFGFVSGTAQILDGEIHSVPFRVTLNDREMFNGFSGDNSQIYLNESLTAEKFETLVKLDSKIQMDLYVQDTIAKSVHYEKISSQKQDFCVLITNRTAKEIAGQIVEQAVPHRRYVASVQGQRTDDLAMDMHGNFSIPLAHYKLNNGPVIVRIEATGDADEAQSSSPASHVELELDYSRYQASVEITGNQIAGLITDFWTDDAAEKGVEVVIDGRPAAFEVAKYSPELSDPAWVFRSGISQRFFDGDPHSVQCRIIESGFVFPARPVMFTTDDQSKAALIRVEQQVYGRLRGWAMLPWSPETIVEMSALYEGKTIATVSCNAFHPMLASNGLLPTHRGFTLDLSSHPDGPYILHFVADGKRISSQSIHKTPFAPFHLRGSGCERRGTCFVIPNPRGDVQDREEARSILLLAAAATEVGGNHPTIVIADLDDTQALELRAAVKDLIGSVATEALTQAEFVALPPPPLDSTVSGAQTAAYCLDIWMRANVFDRLVAPSRNGVAAYCVSSRRQGTGAVANTITIVVDTFAIVDALACDTLLDRPELLFAEALEREALNGADELVAPSALAADRCNEVVRGISTRVRVAAQSVGEAHDGARFIADPDVNWLFFAGPLNTPAGLVLACDALDRLAREIQGTGKAFGVAFAGPEDRVRGKRSGDYVRQRAAKWPFRIRIFRDLNFDSLRRVAAGYGERDAIALTPPALTGTPWDALCDMVALQRLALERIRPDNSSDLADVIFQALDNGSAAQRQPAGNALGRSLAAPASAPGSNRFPGGAALATPLVSVCVSHFNRPTVLRQTLASVMACGYPNLEIVVVDDGSHLPGVASELQKAVDETAPGLSRIVKQRNSYIGAVRNTAARSARGDLLIFMDDDNLAHPDMIETFVDAHHKTGAGIVTSRFGLFNSTDVIDPSSDIPEAVIVPLMPDRGAGVLSNCFGDANMLITRQAFETIGGFTEDYGRGHEDWEFLAKAAMGDIHQELLTKPVFWYRVSDSGMRLNRETETADLQRNIRAYRDHLPTEIYRLLQLAQGMVNCRDSRRKPHHRVPRARMP
ncbi:glycosyltransferase family A protein [uncultured Hoeflea sp.]|uniref:glycosyltransferase family A protein n=1 Tax=uncultured Hoeflea sp. TaxID=538666 RepID=UPI0030D7835B